MGSQEPSAHIAPPYNATDGQDAVRILCAGGTVLDPWQSDKLFTPVEQQTEPDADASMALPLSTDWTAYRSR